jgi:outer membrane cobalamin receptor
MNHKNKFLIFFFFLIFTKNLFSQELREIIEIEENEKNNKTQSFITELQPENKGFETISSIVSKSVSSNITNYGGINSLSTIKIRGSSSNRVLVMIDGIPINGPYGEGVDLSTISISNIEKIEIIRDGISSNYGLINSEGIINIITKDKTQSKISYTHGSFNTNRVDASQSIGMSEFFLTLNFLFENASGDYPLGPYSFIDSEGKAITKRENNNYKFYNFFAKAEKKINPNFKITLSENFNLKNASIPGSINLPTPEAKKNDLFNSNQINIEKKEFILNNLDFAQKIYFNANSNSYFDNIFVSQSNKSNNNNLSLGSKTILKYKIIKQTITIAEEIKHERIKSSVLGNFLRNTNKLFLGNEVIIIPNHLYFFPSIKHEYISQIGSLVNYDIGVNIIPHEKIILKTNYQKSFNAPTFNDLYWPEDTFAKGNSELISEESKYFSGGFELLAFKFFNHEFVYFKKNITNLIQWDIDTDNKWTPFNIGEASFQGVENKLTINANQYLCLDLSHSYLITRDLSEDTIYNGNELPFRPRHKIFGEAKLNKKTNHIDYTISTIGNFSSFIWVNRNSSDYLPSHVTFDTRVTTLFLKNYEASIEVRNILDKRYEEIPLYPREGRAFYMTISAKI